MLVVFQSLQVVGSSPCQGYHLCRGDRGPRIQACQASSPCGQRIWPCQLPDLAHRAQVYSCCPSCEVPLSKVALSGFKLNSCLPYPFLSPHSTDEAAPASTLFPWYTVRIYVLKQRTPSKHLPLPKTLGARAEKVRRLRVCPLNYWLGHPSRMWQHHNLPVWVCGSLMVSISVLSFHIFISGVIICFGISHFCFPSASFSSSLLTS